MEQRSSAADVDNLRTPTGLWLCLQLTLRGGALGWCVPGTPADQDRRALDEGVYQVCKDRRDSLVRIREPDAEARPTTSSGALRRCRETGTPQECHDVWMAATLKQQREAARVLGDLLAAIERGDLTVDGPAANAMLRRLEGAQIALDALTHDGD